MSEQFISEPIKPDASSFDTSFMEKGAPGLPKKFTWRRRKFTVKDVIQTWRTIGPCRHGSKEKYVRRHWFQIRTESGNMIKIYFDKGSAGRRKEMGWRIYTIEE